MCMCTSTSTHTHSHTRVGRPSNNVCTYMRCVVAAHLSSSSLPPSPSRTSSGFQIYNIQMVLNKENGRITCLVSERVCVCQRACVCMFAQAMPRSRINTCVFCAKCPRVVEFTDDDDDVGWLWSPIPPAPRPSAIWLKGFMVWPFCVRSGCPFTTVTARARSRVCVFRI